MPEEERQHLSPEEKIEALKNATPSGLNKEAKRVRSKYLNTLGTAYGLLNTDQERAEMLYTTMVAKRGTYEDSHPNHPLFTPEEYQTITQLESAIDYTLFPKEDDY